MRITISKKYQEVMRDLQENGIAYILIKFPYLVEKSYSDLDMLVSDRDYFRTLNILKEKKFIIYRSEVYFEKYKTVLVTFVKGCGFIKVHLHRRIAWAGRVIIDSNQVIRNRKKINKILFVPRGEDELLISMGHIIFEQFRIGEYDKKLIKILLEHDLDWNYINEQLEKFCWKSEFNRLLSCVQKDAEFKALSWHWGRQFLSIGWLLRVLNLRQTGGVICLLGVDGAGKTSTSRAVANAFGIVEKKSYAQHIGWKPFLPSSRIMHAVGNLKAKEPQLLKGYRQPRKCSFLDELIFFHFFLEHLSRYVFEIYPLLRRTHLLVADRYFYDIFAQDPRAGQSRILRHLIRLFPRPDFIFFLDNEPEVIFKRKREFQISELCRQRNMYMHLGRLIPMHSVKTSVPVKEVANTIIEYSWAGLVSKMAW